MKRIYAVVLVLAMLVSVMPTSALASGETREVHTHKVCGDVNCTEHEEITYQPWTDSTKLPADGNYYLDTDVTLSGNAALTGKLRLCLNGHNVNLNGNVMYLNTEAHICDCTAKTENGVYTAGTISGGKGTNGGAVNTASQTYVKLYLYDGIIENCSASTNGGAVNVVSKATFYMYGGQIRNNTAGNAGGAVFVNASAEFHMYGGAITGNTGKNGGAIGVYDGTVDLKDGVITGNKATAGSGAIYPNGASTVTLTGVTVTGNKGNQAISLSSGSTLNLAGATKIQGNHKEDGTVSNVYLIKDHPGVNASDLGEGANVGVTLAADRISAEQMDITGEMAEGVDPSAYVVSDSNEYEVKLVDKKLVLKQHIHADAIGQGEENTYQPWTDAKSLPAEGNYYLATDVTLSGNAALTGKLHLCLNGHNVNLNRHAIWNQTIAHICDCTAKTENGTYTAGTISGGSRANGAAVDMKAGTKYVALYLYDGIIENCSATTNGGAVNVAAGAKFYMYGGLIKGCQAVNGGAVNVASGAQFHMTGGTIENNSVTTHGGAVYAESDSTVTVSNNTSTIANNTAGKEAGGLYARENSSITITDSTIRGNKANAGSAITVYGGTLTLDGAVIQNNHADAGYGAVHATVTGEFVPTVKLTGKVVISGNTAGKEGEEPKANNLYLREFDYYVSAAGLTEGAVIGVTMDKKRITAGYTDIARDLSGADMAACFVSDDSACAVLSKGTTVYLFKLDSMEYISVQPEVTDSIALNFKVRVGAALTGTEPKMTFVMNGTTLQAVKGPEGETTDNYTIYTFKCSGIMAQNMADKITASLTVGTAAQTYTYSVMDYCKKVLEMDAIVGYNEQQLAALKTMIVDLVSYGAAVQKYRDASIAEESLLTSNLTSEQLELGTKAEDLNGLEGVVSQKLIETNSGEYQWTGVTLVLKEKTNIRCRFTAGEIENLTVVIKAEGAPVCTKGKDDFKSLGDNSYTVDFDSIYAYEYGKKITFEFHNGDSQIGAILHYSVNTYLNAKKDSTIVNLVPLLYKINNYGNAAKNYYNLLGTQVTQ